jgi:uncharacterized OB-fold protein
MSTATVTDEEVFEAFPGVLLNQDNIEYFRGLVEKKLLINRCDDCGYWIYPHRPLCPECWSRNVTPTEVSGKGKVYWFTILYQGREIPGFDYPHLLAGVELEEREGLRYLAPIVNIPHEEVRDGMSVELVWLDVPNGPVAGFQPASE